MKYTKQLLLLLTLTVMPKALLHAGTLHDLVRNGKVEKVEQFLKDNKYVDVNELNLCKDTPLRIACHKKYFEITKLLIEHGADVNKPGYKNNTPLCHACYFWYYKIAKLLLSYGADINKPGFKNEIPFNGIKNWSLEEQLYFFKKLLSIKQKKSETKQDTNTRTFIEFNALAHANLFNQNKTLIPFIIPAQKRDELLLNEDFKDVQNKETIISIGEEILNRLFFGFAKNKQFTFPPLSLFQQQTLQLHSYVKQLELQRDMLVLNNGKFKSIEDFNTRKKLLGFAQKCSAKERNKQKNGVKFDVAFKFTNK